MLKVWGRILDIVLALRRKESLSITARSHPVTKTSLSLLRSLSSVLAPNFDTPTRALQGY